jgi:uncharacterized protein YggE
MEKFFEKDDAMKMGKLFLLVAFVIALLVGMKFINEVKRFGSIGTAPTASNTIDVTGVGEAFAIPDVATAGFSVMQKAKTVAEAQSVVTTKVDAAIAFLKSAGVEEKDIKTADYSAYPEYNYPVCRDVNCSQQPVLTGYTVNQAVTVKIRNTENVGKIVEGLGSAGVTGLTGPDFTVDNLDEVQAEARREAIAEAQERAEELAKDLGVRLVRIVRFSESTGGAYPQAPYYTKDSLGMGGAENAAPQVPAGENKYISNVVITYEIR